MEAVAAMDLSALSRRELQALCKLNGVRANMTNLAMAEALQSLPSVDGIDRIGTTLCLPTPGKSAMKSALRAAVGEDHQQQQQGSPLPRGRRVSVKSPEAIRMDVEGETKWGPAKEIVRTPGVALRSTSRRPRATPAPVPTPAAGTLRRSQRSTARKAAAPAEAEVAATARRSTRKAAKLNMAIDFDQEEEEEKVQAVEPKGVASDVKCDDPKAEEEVTKLLGGNSEADEPEQGEEVVSSVAPIEPAGKSSDDSKVVEEVVEEATEPREGAAIVEEQKSVFEDSPIFGVLSKVAPEPVMKNVENASTEDVEGFGNWSPVLEINSASASEDREVAAVEAVKEDAFSLTVEAADAPNKIILADVTEKEVAVDELPQADPTDDDSGEEYDLNGESSDEAGLAEESSEDDDIDEDEDMQKGGLTIDGDSDETDLTVESSEEDDLDEDEEDMQNAGLTGDGDSDETIEASNSTEVNFDSDEEEEELNMLETGEEMKEDEDSNSLTEGEDDFSGDLSSEFDSDFSDAETESNSSPVALESFHASAPSSAAKSAESAITEETIVKSLDKVTITEKKEECAKEKKPLKVGEGMSLRKLKCAYKESLVAAKEGKKLTIDANEGEGTRVALAELDDNAEC